MRLQRLLPLFLVLASMQIATLRASEIGFEEDFALSTNREETLKQLIPGTEDYYYYHCVHYQNSKQYDKVETLLKQWIDRHGNTQRVEEMRNRQALLAYSNDPAKSLEFVRWRLSLNFDHQRHIPGQNPNQPEKLDAKLIAADTLVKRALNHQGDLSGFEDSALDAVDGHARIHRCECKRGPPPPIAPALDPP